MVIKESKVLHTEDRVIEMIAWALKIPAHMLNPYTDLSEDLYLDHIDRELLIARLEKEFNVILSIEEVARIETIQDASRYIQEHAAA